jgi:hypothetical protein
VIHAYLEAALKRSGDESATCPAEFYFGRNLHPAADEIAEIVNFDPVFRIEYMDRI